MWRLFARGGFVSGDPKTPDDRDLDQWLRTLRGEAKSGSEDHTAERLRSLVEKKQAAAEAEADELRLRRSRDRLITKAREQGLLDQRPEKRRTLLTMAASVAFAAFAGLLGYNVITGPGAQPDILMAYGELERPRGAFPTVTIDAEDPVNRGLQIGEALTIDEVPFELTRANDGALRLSVFLTDDAAAASLEDALRDPVAEITALGYYVIIIRDGP